MEGAGKGAIFVLGLQRSGTTWLANMLAGSGAVAAVTAEDHRGVHESIFFSHFARAFGPWSDPAARAQFRDAFLHSDYYILTGLPADVLDQAIVDAPDPEAVFEFVMQQVAADQGCPAWLEKSPHHTLLASDLARRFPEARFVCVLRDSRTLLASRLAAYGRTPASGLKRARDILRGTAANALYSRTLRIFASGNPQAILLSYDAFAANPDAGRAQLVAFLDLPVTPDALVSAFAANTSHDRGTGTRTTSLTDRAMIRLGDMIAHLLPLSVLSRIEGQRKATRGIDWPDWVWKRRGWRP